MSRIKKTVATVVVTLCLIMVVDTVSAETSNGALKFSYDTYIEEHTKSHVEQLLELQNKLRVISPPQVVGNPSALEALEGLENEHFKRVNLNSNVALINKAESLLTTTMLLTEIADNLTTQMTNEIKRIRAEKQLAVGKMMSSNRSLVYSRSEAHNIIGVQRRAKVRYDEVYKQTGDTLKAFTESAMVHNFEHYILTSSSGLTARDLDALLGGTALDGLGSDFIQAEEKWGVNAYALMAIAIHESNWGKSRLAQNKNNLFGYMAYDRDPYNSARQFATKSEAIMTVAEALSTNYLSVNGKYNYGQTLKGVNVKYASDPQWHTKITSLMLRLLIREA